MIPTGCLTALFRQRRWDIWHSIRDPATVKGSRKHETSLCKQFRQGYIEENFTRLWPFDQIRKHCLRAVELGYNKHWKSSLLGMHSLIGIRNCPNHRAPVGMMESHKKSFRTRKVTRKSTHPTSSWLRACTTGRICSCSFRIQRL